MANDTKFTHISVTIDDDDDFVIEAGAPAEVVAEPEPVEAALEVAQPEPVAEPEPIPAPVVSAPATAPVSQKPAAKEYRGTTLEDLEGEKMSGMQKGVIAAAFVAIIAFVVWYLVL